MSDNALLFGNCVVMITMMTMELKKRGKKDPSRSPKFGDLDRPTWNGPPNLEQSKHRVYIYPYIYISDIYIHVYKQEMYLSKHVSVDAG